MELHKLLTMFYDVEGPIRPFSHAKSWHGLYRYICIENSMGVYSWGDLIFNDRDKML